jgi:cytochrome P450
LPFLADLKRTQGDVASLPFGRNRFFLVSHPEEIKRVLVSHQRDYLRVVVARKRWRVPRFPEPTGLFQPQADPDVHLRARRALQPAFSRARADVYWPTFLRLSEEGVARWPAGETIDIVEEIRVLAVELGVAAVFGEQLPMPLDDLMRRIRTVIFGIHVASSGSRELVSAVRLRRLLQLRDAQEEILSALTMLLERRRRDGGQRDDVLSLLVRIADAEGLNERELALEAFGHLFSFPDSTPNAIAWALYSLVCNPDALARVRDEVDRLGDVEAVRPDELPYTHAVLNETLRLYPPAWRLARQALVDHELGGRAVRAGDHVWVCPYLVHRDERWWPNPDRFAPERWFADADDRRHPATFVPFSSGHRRCAGEVVAMREMAAVLAAVVRRWHMSLSARAKVQLQPDVVLRPRWGIPMRLELR